ncbi:MAG: hypothetical protein JSU81_07290 [Candidatus Coatesbacteria bacterium]|nr:MAG: hypothetical protein JSU81_07290 [Candidatus Coatesbacteria bacterium]
MAKYLSRHGFGVIIVAALAFASAPAAAQEGGEAGGEGDAGIKEEAGVRAEKLATGEYMFEETVIEGRLEKPVALFIKRQQPDFATVRFARDFWDDILRPIDKEEFERAIKETKFDYVKNPLLWMAVTTAATTGAAAGYQAYNEEWGQVKVYGITCGAAAASALVLILIDRGRERVAK